ncbi:MAG TPA: ATP12 family protein [Rhizomicrobium sp.]|nr:ATP12 family protein [Rhizomicrobium sp.]
MNRFYKDVTLAEAEGGFHVLLDGKPVRTPGRKPLLLPTHRLAEAVAAEWRDQGDEIVATSMPLLRLSNTVIDGVAVNRTDVITAILRFGENDLLCYRAHQPPALANRQAEGWDPVLAWARQRLGARLHVAEGVTHLDQPPDALTALREVMEGYDAWTLAGLHVIASVTGSLVLGLAVVEGHITGPNAFRLSRIDETDQIEKWGQDAEAEKRAAHLAQEVDRAVDLIAALR